jgi:hypothetical protein
MRCAFIHFFRMKAVPLTRVSTFFLKVVIVLIGAAALALCIFLLPNVWNGAAVERPVLTRVLYPGLIGIYLTIVPFVFALYQAFMLLRHIDTNNAFSDSSIKALRSIKYSAVAMSVLYAFALPLIVAIADLDDAPGLILMGFAFVCSPLIVSTFAAVLQKLVQSAVAMKSEHDLTV